MHPYATDSPERRTVTLILSVLSILAAWCFASTLEALHLGVPWWLDAPSVVGFYGAFYAGFDRYLWRIPIFRTIRLVRIPRLDGTWQGYAASSFDNHADHHPVSVHIAQTWTHIRIGLAADKSQSHSLVASLLVEGISPTLTYLYLNEPKADAVNTMHTHRGTVQLTLQADRSLDGEYYTGRDRQSYGVLHLTRS